MTLFQLRAFHATIIPNQGRYFRRFFARKNFTIVHPYDKLRRRENQWTGFSSWGKPAPSWKAWMTDVLESPINGFRALLMGHVEEDTGHDEMQQQK